MYSTISTIAMTTETFHLVRNKIDVGRLRLFYTLGVFILPTIFANAFFYSTLGLKGVNLIVATSIIALALLNVVIYLINRATRGNVTIIFGFQNLRIITNPKETQVIPFENITITRLSYEMDDIEHPAIRMDIKNLPCMTIGCKKSTKHWKNVEGTVECTAFLVHTEEEWKRLLNVLDYFIESK